jgi:hypothetical protein
VQQLADECAQKMTGLNNCVNGTGGFHKQRVYEAKRKQIEQWFAARRAELGIVSASADPEPEPPAAPASGTPSAEASPPAVVAPGKKI